MDILAALGLALVIEGLMLAVFAGSLNELMAVLRQLGDSRIRQIGLITAVAGAALYLVIRG